MVDRTSISRGILAEGYSDADELLDDRPELADSVALIESAGSWLKSVGNELGRVAPGALQGALTGFLMGGPAGAAIGAAKSAGSQLGVPAKAMQTAQAVISGNTAASQLLATLLSPQTVQALGAMALGKDGAQTISVAGTRVPVAAFANLLATLASQAAAAQHVSAPPPHSAPTYAGANASTPVARAEALLSLLAEAQESDADEDWDDGRHDEWDEGFYEHDAWGESHIEQDLYDPNCLEAE